MKKAAMPFNSFQLRSSVHPPQMRRRRMTATGFLGLAAIIGAVLAAVVYVLAVIAER